MISKRMLKRYCCEDISLIENYDEAVSDTTQIWACHHRKETDDNMSIEDLKRLDLYWHRPASELIFLTPNDHSKIHADGEMNPRFGDHCSDEQKQVLKEKLKGREPWNVGLTKEDDKRLAELGKKVSNTLKTNGSLLGENNPWYGHHEKRPNLVGKTGPRKQGWKLVDGKRIYFKKEELANENS